MRKKAHHRPKLEEEEEEEEKRLYENDMQETRLHPGPAKQDTDKPWQGVGLNMLWDDKWKNGTQ